MSNLFNDIFKNIETPIFIKIGKVFNLPENKIKDFSKDSIQILLGGLMKNINNSKDAKKIIEILEKDHLNNLENIDIILNKFIEKKPEKILEHIFNDKKNLVIKKISKLNKININITEEVLEKITCLFMGSLAQTISRTNMNGDVFLKVLEMAYESDLKNNKILSILEEKKKFNFFNLFKK